jgi:hypothetical protein
MMKEGKFRKKTQVAFMYVDGTYYLTNGQHTLAAIELSGVAQELSVVINTGDNMDDVADDFARHDTHLTRQFGDSLVAHAVHEELGLTPRALHFATASIIYYAWATGETGQRFAQQLTHDEKLALVRKHGHLAAQALGFFEGATSRGHLTRRTTVAPAMLCAKVQPETAEQFFRTMAMDDGLRQGDPRKTILEWLRARTTPGGRYSTTSVEHTKVAADHELVKAIASAWNAWIDGRELRAIRINFDLPTAEFKNVGTLTVRNTRSGGVKK